MPRRKLDIPDEEVHQLVRLGASNVDIAAFFKCDEGTIRKRFSEILSKGRVERKIALREWQWKAAERGDVKMLIFLGKNVLGQADKVETRNEHRHAIDEDRQRAMLADPEALDLACRLDERLARVAAR